MISDIPSYEKIIREIDCEINFIMTGTDTVDVSGPQLSPDRKYDQSWDYTSHPDIVAWLVDFNRLSTNIPMETLWAKLQQDGTAEMLWRKCGSPPTVQELAAHYNARRAANLLTQQERADELDRLRRRRSEYEALIKRICESTCRPPVCIVEYENNHKKSCVENERRPGIGWPWKRVEKHWTDKW